MLAALYCLVIRRSPLGNECFIVASDEDQAGDDLALARKLVTCNPDLSAESSARRRNCACATVPARCASCRAET